MDYNVSAKLSSGNAMMSSSSQVVTSSEMPVDYRLRSWCKASTYTQRSDGRTIFIRSAQRRPAPTASAHSSYDVLKRMLAHPLQDGESLIEVLICLNSQRGEATLSPGMGMAMDRD